MYIIFEYVLDFFFKNVFVVLNDIKVIKVRFFGFKYVFLLLKMIEVFFYCFFKNNIVLI